jgi:hypothetical protein
MLSFSTDIAAVSNGDAIALLAKAGQKRVHRARWTLKNLGVWHFSLWTGVDVLNSLLDTLNPVLGVGMCAKELGRAVTG